MSLVNSSNFLDQPGTGDKLFAVAQISKQLFSRPSLSTIASCSNILPLLSDIGQITLVCLKFRLDNMEDTWFLDAIDDMLFMWASIVGKTDELSRQELQQLMQEPLTGALLTLLSQISFEIVQGYIEMRVVMEPSDDDDDDAFDQKDVDSFSDQLLNISILARLKAGEVLGALSRVLSEKNAQLSSLMASTEAQSVETIMKLQEQIHWGILIAGHVLCDGAEGEMPQIPESLLVLSSSSPGGSADHVVFLTTTIFGILDSLGYPLHSTQHVNCSPLLIETLFWFCCRWTCSYLFPNPMEYANLRYYSLENDRY